MSHATADVRSPLSGLDCCGGPFRAAGLKQRDMLVVWADGGVVTRRARACRFAARRLRAAARGRTVAVGRSDRAAAGSRFELRHAEGDGYVRPPKVFRVTRISPVIAMMISGPRALRSAARAAV